MKSSPIPTLLGGDGQTSSQTRSCLPKIIAPLDRTQETLQLLWNPEIMASLNFQEEPSIKHAIKLIQAQGGSIVEMIGEPVYCLIFEIPNKGYFLYSDIVKRFYNSNPTSPVPEAMKHCRYFTTEQRIGVYIDRVGNTDMLVFLLMDFSFQSKPIIINDVPYSYGITDPSYKIQSFSRNYKRT